MKRSVLFTIPIAGQALLLFFTLCAIWGAIWFQLAAEHSRAIRDAEDQAVSRAESLSENMTRSAMILDTALRNSRELYLRDPAHFKVGQWMRDKAVLMKIAIQMSIVDASGIVVTSSGDNGPPAVNVSDREHFQVQAAATEDRLFISKPVVGRGSGRLSIQFTRRMVNADGGFAGIAIVSFDPLVISQLRDGARLDGGFTMLIGTDGIIRAAQPMGSLVGTTFPEAGILRAVNADGDGSPVNGMEKVVGRASIVSYRKITGYPLFVAAGFPNSTVFALYGRERQIDVAAGGVLSLIILFIGVIFIRDRWRLTRFHEALMLTLENISQGILMVDSRRRMPVVNRRVAELLGLPMELVAPGASFDDLVRWQVERGDFRSVPPDARGLATLDQRDVSNQDMPFYERTRPNGTVLEVRTTILRDGSAVRTFTDVTERKRIEGDLARARDDAEDVAVDPGERPGFSVWPKML